MDNENALLELLHNGYDINARISSDNPFKDFSPKIEGMNALQFACENRSTRSVNVLLENDADFTSKNSLGLTALHSAVDYSCKSKWNVFERIFNPDCAAPRVLSAHVKNNVTTNPVNNHGLSHFHIACMFSHVEAVKLFLNSGVPINEAIHNDSPILPSHTALHIAAHYGSFAVVQLLLDHGADVYALNDDGYVPLQLIFARLEELSSIIADLDELEGSIEFVRDILSSTSCIASILIQETFKPNTRINELCIACAKKCSASVSEIIDKGVDINARTDFGFTALHCAALVDMKMTELLLNNGADIRLRNDDDKSSLDICTCRSGYHIFKLLPFDQQLRKFIISDGQSWRIALALHSNPDLTNLLSDESVTQDINKPCIAHESPAWPGATPLHLAVIFARNDLRERTSIEPVRVQVSERIGEIILTLISHGASTTQQDAKGRTPVHLAFYLKKIGILHMLLNPYYISSEIRHLVSRENSSDETGLSHFHIASMIGCQKSMIALYSNSLPYNEPIKSDVKVNLDPSKPEILFKAGSTPMHIAARLKKIDAIKLLAARCADISIKDVDGLTPIDLIASNTDFDDLELMQITIFLMYKYCFYDTQSVVPNDEVSHFKALCRTLNPVVFHASHGICFKSSRSQVIDFLKTDDEFRGKDIHGIETYYNCLWKIKELMDEGFDNTAVATRYMKALKKISEYDSNYKLSNYACFRNYAETILSNCKSFVVVDVESQMTTLHLACTINRGDWVEELLAKSSIDVNCRLSTDSPLFPGSTPLHLAITCYEKKTLHDYADGIVKMMLKHGADPTIQDVNGETPLHLADKYRLTAITNLLLRDERIAEKNLTSKFGRSHFHIACSRGLPEVVEKFLRLGADPNGLNHACDNELWRVLPIGRIPSFFAFTPLWVAKNLDVIKILLSYGADLKIKDYRGWTALHYAVKIGRGTDVIKTLIRDGKADVNSCSVLHLTPLDLIVTRRIEIGRNISRIRTLLEHGALINHKNFEDSSTFARALELDDVELLQTLIKYGKDVSDLNERKQTAMHGLFGDEDSLDTVEEYIAVIEQLCERGIDIDSQDYLKRTPLHAAVQNDLREGVTALLASGADINIKDYMGHTPFSLLMSDIGKSGDSDDSFSFSEREKISLVFCKHIQKMKAFKLPISRRNTGVEEIAHGRKRSEDCIEEFQKSPELEKMRNTILGEDVTLHDVMYMDSHQLANFAENVLFEKTLRSKKFHKIFSEFGGILKLKFRIGQRRKLINLARKSLYSLLKMRLPVVCIELVVLNLSNVDLKTLADMIGK